MSKLTLKRVPTVLILSGIPCAGKSTYAMSHLSNNRGWDIAWISRDNIRWQMDKSNYQHTKSNEKQVTKEFYKRLVEAADEGRDIIIDNTNCTEKYLNEFINFFDAKYPEYNVAVKFFDISFIKALIRDFIRSWNTDKSIPYKVMWRMYKNYNKINRDKYESYLFEN